MTGDKASPQRRFGCVAIVPAGGNGSRFGSVTAKQYCVIAGKTVLEHTLAALARCTAIERIFVSVQADDLVAVDVALMCPDVIFLRSAGNTRAATVQNALAEISKLVARDAWVLVHDAARPCVGEDELSRLIVAVTNHPVGGLLATPVTDTIKRATPAREITETIPRAGLWRAQTPQMFRYETLRHALSSSPDVTDEAQAIEALGMSPLIVEGSVRNIKITVPEDAELAALYLARNTR